MEIIYGVLEQGLIYGLVGMAIFLTLRVIDFPDMGVNNSFTSGAAAWYCATKVGIDPYSASVIAYLTGFTIGYITASLHLFFNIKPLLAGIIIMIALYSVNLRLMGKPNIPLMNYGNIFGNSNERTKIIILFSIIGVFWVGLSWFLMSEIGLGIRVSGQNYMLGETYGVSKNFTVGIIMALSNGIIGFAGALLGQAQGFIDINMGNGLIISGLVSVIIGEKILATTKVYLMVIMSVIGTIIYKVTVMLALFSSDIGLQSSDIYMITALMMVGVMFKKKTN
jgi:putative ABC transport system permease protein